MQHYKKPVWQFTDPISKTPLYYLLSKEIQRLTAVLDDALRVKSDDNPTSTQNKLANLPYNVKVMLSVMSAAGLTPVWWVYGTSKAPDVFRFAQTRQLLKDAAVYSYAALFDSPNELLLPRQLVALLDEQKLVRQTSFDSVQIGMSRWFLLKKI